MYAEMAFSLCLEGRKSLRIRLAVMQARYDFLLPLRERFFDEVCIVVAGNRL